jgi:hypothetical protein
MLIALIVVWLGIYTFNNSSVPQGSREILNTIVFTIICIIAAIVIVGISQGAFKLQQ